MEKQKLRSANTAGWLLALVCILLLLYSGQTLFVPLFYGLFIAIVLYPVCRWLEKHGFSKSMAIGTGLLLVLLLFAVLIWIIFLQFNAFMSDWPELKAKLQPALNDGQQWLETNFNLSIASQNEWWQKTSGNLSANSTGMLEGFFSKTASGLFALFIIPVFAALFLYNRRDFVSFLEKLFGDDHKERLHHILHQTIGTYFHFIKGMVIVYLLVGILNSIGLLVLGIRHAILFGFLTAIMTIIPYVGITISALLPITIAWITKDSIWYPLGVVGVFVLVQYLEANVIFPRVVATQLNISTWATLVAIIAGGILWGVSGMILFIPFLGMLKLVTDNVPEWEALNILIRRNEKPKK
ncbi:MAG TPA: AI-2E family transporter [Chitinophagaceae bacterium]|nr:AI-2E family transporter [Chitinophagaceae bacterium]